MNNQQLHHAEVLLGIELPHPYRRFLGNLPDHGGTACWEAPICIQIINDPDMLVVNNWELRDLGPVFARRRWPEKYLAIGDDGCGNNYCLDVGNDPSVSLLMYDHDPEDDFIEVAPSYSELFDILLNYQPEVDDGDFAATVEKGLIVTRAPAPWKSILQPIGLDEWLAYLRMDRSVKYLGYREQRNPFTQEAMRMHWPGYAVWEQADRSVVPIEYRFGRIIMKGESASAIEKMRCIAQGLNARLFGPNGAEIEVH